MLRFALHSSQISTLHCIVEYIDFNRHRSRTMEILVLELRTSTLSSFYINNYNYIWHSRAMPLEKQ